MSKALAANKPIESPPNTAKAGRVFKLSLEGVPPVDEKVWSQMEVAARTPRKNRRYPTLIETPDI